MPLPTPSSPSWGASTLAGPNGNARYGQVRRSGSTAWGDGSFGESPTGGGRPALHCSASVAEPRNKEKPAVVFFGTRNRPLGWAGSSSSACARDLVFAESPAGRGRSETVRLKRGSNRSFCDVESVWLLPARVFGSLATRLLAFEGYFTCSAYIDFYTIIDIYTSSVSIAVHLIFFLLQVTTHLIKKNWATIVKFMSFLKIFCW